MLLKHKNILKPFFIFIEFEKFVCVSKNIWNTHFLTFSFNSYINYTGQIAIRVFDLKQQ